MRRHLRWALVVVLSLAMSASGATLSLARMADDSGTHVHGADHAQHSHHAHQAQAEQTGHDEGAQPSGDHPSKNCCTACTVASPLPPSVDLGVELMVSAAVYSNLSRVDVAVAIQIDPGIPKRMG